MRTRTEPNAAVEPTIGHLLVNAGMGGAENYVALLANARAAVGLPSRVVVFTEPGPLSTRFAGGVDVSYLGYRRASIRNPMRFVRSLFRGYRVIAQAVREAGIDVVQTHLPNTNLWGLVLALRGDCRVVVTIHNNKFLHSPGGTRIGMFCKRLAYREIVRYCPAVVAVSDEVRSSFIETLGLSRRLADRVLVVDNGVPVPEPLSSAGREAVRTAHGVRPDEAWVVAAGRLTEAKNFGCLIEAAALLRDCGTPVRIVIGGDGPLRDELEAHIVRRDLGAQVSLPGNLDNLREIMLAADMLAMPSRWEGLPLVLLEAMACGLPVVGTRIKGIADTIEDGVHGVLVDVDDPSQLAGGLARLASEPDLAGSMGKRGLQRVRDRYDFARVYDEMNGIWSRAANRS